MTADPTVALERVRNLHRPCHVTYGYLTEGVCAGHEMYGPATCLGCGKPSPCPTLREVEPALRLSVAERGGMRPMWTFEGDGLRDLLDDLDRTRYLGAIYRVRFAVDEGDLKWKINEDMWSPGKAADGKARS